MKSFASPRGGGYLYMYLLLNRNTYRGQDSTCIYHSHFSKDDEGRNAMGTLAAFGIFFC